MKLKIKCDSQQNARIYLEHLRIYQKCSQCFWKCQQCEEFLDENSEIQPAPSFTHLEGIHFLLPARSVWKMNPNSDDMMRLTHKRYSNYASSTPSTSTLTACNVRLWNHFLQLCISSGNPILLGLGFEMQNFALKLAIKACSAAVSGFKGTQQCYLGQRCHLILIPN